MISQGGKGRTGTVISSYFLYSGLCSDVSEAISIFGGRRMAEKQGVTQPSQIRYDYSIDIQHFI